MHLLGLILVGASLSVFSRCIAAASNSLLQPSLYTVNTKPFVPKFSFFKNRQLMRTCYGAHLRRNRNQPGGLHWILPAECFDKTKYDMVWVYGYEKVVAKTTIDSIPCRLHPQYNASTKAHNIAVVSFNSHQDPVKGYSHIELPSEPEDFDIFTLELFKHNKSCTNESDFHDEISLYRVKTKPINSFWCRLLYRSSAINENHMCISGWFGKGLSEDEFGTPVITLQYRTYKLVGLTTIVRPWTHYVSFPLEVLKIEPYLDWINSILDEEALLS